MKERLFKFKQFEVRHGRSSIPIGADAVLLGAWGEVSGSKVLDVGCGCGIIALMAAQRNIFASIVGIDIDKDSIEESCLNFQKSPWRSRLSAEQCDVKDAHVCFGKFDAIISNPPFFNAGVDARVSPRMSARHQGCLSPEGLLAYSDSLLNCGGTLSMIFPTEMLVKLIDASTKSFLYPERICNIAHHEGSKVKRSMVQWRKLPQGMTGGVERMPGEEMLVLFDEDGTPSPEHKELCGCFYLKW